MHHSRHLGLQRPGLELKSFDRRAMNFVGKLDVAA